MATRSLVIVTAGLSQPSVTRLLGDRLATATTAALGDAGIATAVEVIELRDHAQDLVNHLLTRFPSPKLAATIGRVTDADGLVVVAPIFNASYSGLFKLFFDVIERDGLSGVPVVLAATGGTERHSLALEHAMRPLFAYLGAATVPTAVYAASADWGTEAESLDGDLVDRIARAAGELAIAVAMRVRGTRRDPFEEPVSFKELLRGRH
jgi:FMN reductase